MDEVQNSIEIWEPVFGFPRYSVSSLGRVRGVKGGILIPKIDRYGYQALSLRIDGKMYYRTVHTLVCLTFNGPKPTPKHKVNHKDGVKPNNRPENLEWVTTQRNIEHARELGLLLKIQDYFPVRKGMDSPNAKLTEKDVREIRSFPDCWGNTEISKFYGVGDSTICRIRKRHDWKHV